MPYFGNCFVQGECAVILMGGSGKEKFGSIDALHLFSFPSWRRVVLSRKSVGWVGDVIPKKFVRIKRSNSPIRKTSFYLIL